MDYNNGTNYYNNSQANNNYNKFAYTRVPRGWLKFAQIAGAVFSVIGMIIYIYYMKDIYHSLPVDDLASKSITALLLAVIVYFVWRSIYTASIIVRWVSKSSDEELCANRYIISALSLSVGGFFTPFLVTSFPNIDTVSTVKPRYFLSKTMGLCILIGAPIFAFSYFLPLFSGTNPVSNMSFIFSTSSQMGIISIVVLAVSCVAFVFGILTTSLFFTNKTKDAFANNQTGLLLKLVSGTWMAILTIELVIVIISAVIRLIGALMDLLQAGNKGEGIFFMLFALMNLLITISYVGMIVYVTLRTMAGLWSFDGSVKIARYNHGKWANQSMNGTKTYQA